MQASPLLEDDYFRYLWDGRQMATQLNPYQYPPQHFFGDTSLAPQWQDILSGINYPEVPSIYGPVLQLLFGLAYFIAPADLGSIKAILFVADMLLLTLLARWQVPAPYLLVYAMHPLVLKESMASAHPDIVVALFLVCAMHAWRTHRAAITGLFLALAVATKVPALITIPFFLMSARTSTASTPPAASISFVKQGSKSIHLLISFCAVLLLLYLPFLIKQSSELSALITFSGQWQFNPLLFRIFSAFFEPRFARLLSGLALLAGLAALLLRQRRDAKEVSMPICAALTLLLLLSPTVNPWYWLWALGPAIYLGQSWVVAAACIAMVSYWNTSVIPISAIWNWPWIIEPSQAQASVPLVSTLFQILTISLFWIKETRREKVLTNGKASFNLPAHPNA